MKRTLPFPREVLDRIAKRSEEGYKNFVGDRERNYSVINLDNVTTIAVPPFTGSHDPRDPDRVNKRVNVSGDHVYIARVDGSVRWGLKFGTNAGIIPIFQGMTLARRYEYLTIYELDAGYQALSGAPSQSMTRSSLKLIACYGELIRGGSDRQYGMAEGFTGQVDAVAGVIPRVYCADAYTLPNFSEMPVYGRDGAILFLKNEDAANDLYLVSAAGDWIFAPVFQDVYRLRAGEGITVPLDGSVSHFDQAAPAGLCVRTRAGTCKYSWMITRRATLNIGQGSPGEPM